MKLIDPKKKLPNIDFLKDDFSDMNIKRLHQILKVFNFKDDGENQYSIFYNDGKTTKQSSNSVAILKHDLNVFIEILKYVYDKKEGFEYYCYNLSDVKFQNCVFETKLELHEDEHSRFVNIQEYYDNIRARAWGSNYTITKKTELSNKVGKDQNGLFQDIDKGYDNGQNKIEKK